MYQQYFENGFTSNFQGRPYLKNENGTKRVTIFKDKYTGKITATFGFTCNTALGNNNAGYEEKFSDDNDLIKKCLNWINNIKEE